MLSSSAAVGRANSGLMLFSSAAVGGAAEWVLIASVRVGSTLMLLTGDTVCCIKLIFHAACKGRLNVETSSKWCCCWKS